MGRNARVAVGVGWAMGSADPDVQTVEHRVTESRRVPALGLVLGYGAMVPFVAGAAAAWLLGHGGPAALATDLTVLWGGAILAFLAGVRRGLSFRTEGAPPWPSSPPRSACSPWASRRWRCPAPAWHSPCSSRDTWAWPCSTRGPPGGGEAPLFFARLRPLQMLVPIAGFAALLAHLALKP